MRALGWERESRSAEGTALELKRVYHAGWIRRFILFHNKRHPREMAAAEVRRFLSQLATDGQVSASTQNQALGALLFLYRQVLRLDLDRLEGVERARTPEQLPVVLTRAEVRAVLAKLSGVPWLGAMLLCGSGLRLGEALELRVKDHDDGVHAYGGGGRAGIEESG